MPLRSLFDIPCSHISVTLSPRPSLVNEFWIGVKNKSAVVGVVLKASWAPLLVFGSPFQFLLRKICHSFQLVPDKPHLASLSIHFLLISLPIFFSEVTATLTRAPAGYPPPPEFIRRARNLAWLFLHPFYILCGSSDLLTLKVRSSGQFEWHDVTTTSPFCNFETASEPN